ncbi:MAG: hypothetical protein V7K84_04325 [Nostoc sp.]
MQRFPSDSESEYLVARAIANWFFKNSSANYFPFPGHFTRQSDVYRDEFHQNFKLGQ